MYWRDLPKEWQKVAREKVRDMINLGYEEMYNRGDTATLFRVRANSCEVTEYLDTCDRDWVLVEDDDGELVLGYDLEG